MISWAITCTSKTLTGHHPSFYSPNQLFFSEKTGKKNHLFLAVTPISNLAYLINFASDYVLKKPSCNSSAATSVKAKTPMDAEQRQTGNNNSKVHLIVRKYNFF